jgi:2-polyprenyl-3-methyl-5-hydroxy-6-metoxy-1,4-benzoquinol methylase
MTAAPATHLDYYLRHGLNPVHYDMAEPKRHLERRSSLYRTLGLPAVAFRGANVLEVAPGSGQNSLFVASCEPASLTLVEPNPTAIQDIRKTYDRWGGALHPHIIRAKLQDWHPRERFDIVLCENWLGCSTEERQLLKKLAQFVAERGVLVVTTVAPVGVVWNVLRKALTSRLIAPADSFTRQSEILAEAFGPHLQTIPSMTRSVQDWIHDNVMNPAYMGIMLSLPMAIDDLGSTLSVLGTSPRFGSDWRWFKSLQGDQRAFNSHYLQQYARSLHNFADYRSEWPERDPDSNWNLEAAAVRVGDCVRDWELAQNLANRVDTAMSLLEAVEGLRGEMDDLPQHWQKALEEFLRAFENPNLTPAMVAEMPHFRSAFGRETVYVSFEHLPE